MDRRTVLRSLAGATVATSLAGCLDALDQGEAPDESMGTTTESTTETEMDTTTAETTTTDASAATVQVSSHPDYGDILVDSEGMSLYMFEQDTNGAGASTCSGDCAAAWPPLTVSDSATAGDGVTASLTTFEREDGSTQVAAAGWPLYYFAPDEQPGDTNGQGVDGFGAPWYLLAPDGTPIEGSGGTTTETTTDGGGGGDSGNGGNGGYY